MRQRLLAAAVELIPERGWAAVSTRVLAERAGVTPSVVHYHFPSLPALLSEAALGGLRQALEEVGELFGSAQTPAAAIDATLAVIDRYTGSDPASLLAVEAYLAATRDSALRAEIAGILDDFRRQVEYLFRAHEVPLPEATAAVVAAAIDGLLMHRGLDATPDTEAAAGVLHRLVD